MRLECITSRRYSSLGLLASSINHHLCNASKRALHLMILLPPRVYMPIVGKATDLLSPPHSSHTCSTFYPTFVKRRLMIGLLIPIPLTTCPHRQLVPFVTSIARCSSKGDHCSRCTPEAVAHLSIGQSRVLGRLKERERRKNVSTHGSAA